MELTRLFCFFFVIFLLNCAAMATASGQDAESSNNDATPKKILIILTNTDKIANTDIPSGWYLPELAHPYKAFLDAGFQMDSVSPNGGKAPVDPASVERYKDDPTSQWFQGNADAQALVDNTKTPSEIDPSDYVAVYYPGGHGPMFDLAYDEDIANITLQVFQDGGVVGAMCHGPAGLLPVKLANGDPFVKGRKVTSISNAEEELAQLSSVLPFLLETKLKEQGALYSAAEPFQAHVVVDGRLVTGQNPPSAQGLATQMINLLK